MKKLDKTDHMILNILQKNARITNQELANQIALSPSSCLQRVRRLEDEKVISGYHAKINLHAVWRSVTYILTVKLKSHPNNGLSAFHEILKLIPEVVEYHTVNGEYDFILKIICRDMPAYLAINDQLIASPEYSATINTHIVLEDNKAFTSIDLNTLT